MSLSNKVIKVFDDGMQTHGFLASDVREAVKELREELKVNIEMWSNMQTNQFIYQLDFILKEIFGKHLI
jgi:argonaute-like protein implicated in RNA metabolism and viral defense